MLFSGKENIFKCLVAFQKMFWKIFSGVWFCSWKYHRKHIFYLWLTFSHIFSATKQIYNIIHSSIEKHKQNPEKNIIKSDQIERRRKRERRLGLTRGEIAQRRRRRDRTAWCCDRDRHDRREGKIAISAVLWRSEPVQKGKGDRERERDRQRELRTRRRDLATASGVGPLCLWVVLCLSLSPFACLWTPLFARLNSGSDLKVK